MNKHLILILTFLSLSVNGQEKIDMKDIKGPPAQYVGYHITDTRLDKFTGIWQLLEQEKSFTLFLEKELAVDMRSKYKTNLIMDIAKGQYRYCQNDSESCKESAYEMFFNLGTTDTKWSLGFVVRDGLDGHLYSGTLKIDRFNPNQASLKFYQQEKLTIITPQDTIPKKQKGVEIPGGLRTLEGKILQRVKRD